MTNSVLGVDVSHYEPAIDWHKAEAGGVQWMYAKASEGVGHIDSMLKSHCSAASAAGIFTGAYHFFHASMDGDEQARLYLRTVQGMDLKLPHCLDWEEGSADGEPRLFQQAEAYKWLSAVEKATGKTPVIYGGESFLRGLQLPSLFARYPLWVAHYGVREIDVHTPTPWPKFTMWQYTDAETIPGLAHGHHVDASYFNGTLQDLKAFAS